MKYIGITGSPNMLDSKLFSEWVSLVKYQLKSRIYLDEYKNGGY